MVIKTEYYIEYLPSMEPINPAPKIKIILKPGVLGKQNLQQAVDNLAQQPNDKVKRRKKTNEIPIPASITLINPTPQENKFSGKIRNVLDGLTFAVQSYIIHNLDNEGTGQAYKSQLQTGLAKIREDFITSRIGNATRTCSTINSAVNNPAI